MMKMLMHDNGDNVDDDDDDNNINNEDNDGDCHFTMLYIYM